MVCGFVGEQACIRQHVFMCVCLIACECDCGCKTWVMCFMSESVCDLMFVCVCERGCVGEESTRQCSEINVPWVTLRPTYS